MSNRFFEKRSFEIKDEFYIFSMNSADMGTIVEFRSGNTAARHGVNFFDIIEFSDEEKDFLSESLFEYGKRSVLAVDSKKRRAVFFLRDFVFSCHVCLAVVFLMPAADVCGVIREITGVEVSGSAQLTSSDPGLIETNVYSYVTDFLYRYGSIHRLKPEMAEDSELLGKILKEVAGICYINADLKTEPRDVTDKFVRTDVIFSEGFCALALFIVFMFARRYAANRSAEVLIRPKKDYFYIDMVFDLYNDSYDDSGLKYLEALSSGMDVLYGFKIVDRQVKVSFVPFYPDIGQTGVKNQLFFELDL